MNRKKLEIEYDERRSLESAVDQLQSLVDGLRAGALTIARGDRRLLFLVKPGSPLEFTLHAERVGDRERLELALEWRRQHVVSQHLAIGGGEPRLQQPVEASLPLDPSTSSSGLGRQELEHDQLEAYPLDASEDDSSDDSDDLEEEDWEGAAETLRQSNQLAQALQYPMERQPERH